MQRQPALHGGEGPPRVTAKLNAEGGGIRQTRGGRPPRTPVLDPGAQQGAWGGGDTCERHHQVGRVGLQPGPEAGQVRSWSSR